MGHSQETNDNGKKLCASKNLLLSKTISKHKNIYRKTWVSLEGRAKNEIDEVD